MTVRAHRSRQAARKLLIIDDDTKLLSSYRELLTPYGFEVLVADDGTKAIPIVEEHPDILLVILDLVMPSMDGKTWLRWFRQRNTEAPVIIISAHKLGDEDRDLLPAAVLDKPFHVAELLDLVGLFCGLGTPGGSMQAS